MKIPKEKREFVIRRDGHCQRCQSTKKLTVHHITPLHLGGNHSTQNLVTLCWRCHEEWHTVVLREHTGNAWLRFMGATFAWPRRKHREVW